MKDSLVRAGPVAERFLTPISENETRRFVVLDRDGTLIEEREYVSDPDEVRLIPGAGQALRELSQMGFGLVVITNQSGVGRGFFDDVQLRSVHGRLNELLEAEGVRLDGLYVCPHKPDDGCDCRKPKLGLLKKAAQELDFRLENCVVIGDKISDIEMGRAIGATTFLVRTGYGAEIAAEGKSGADHVVDDLARAVAVIRKITGKQPAENRDR
ncbi:MAG TPA: D-glycero-beta-D-manno-heptose 1,7-bisphosphate 7-phosphatase [Candidatus Acidoferrales bacterium]|nr:D-glycero-beta-D-manno-heptose 1,7-bisphosphate 7-phosphatase [Candidatus Acidoferrales bacterium]